MLIETGQLLGEEGLTKQPNIEVSRFELLRVPEVPFSAIVWEASGWLC
jgi:hypothetical protein